MAFALGGCGSLAGGAVDGASSTVRGGANPGRRSTLGFPPLEAAAAADFAGGWTAEAAGGTEGPGRCLEGPELDSIAGIGRRRRGAGGDEQRAR